MSSRFLKITTCCCVPGLQLVFCSGFILQDDVFEVKSGRFEPVFNLFFFNFLSSRRCGFLDFLSNSSLWAGDVCDYSEKKKKSCTIFPSKNSRNVRLPPAKWDTSFILCSAESLETKTPKPPGVYFLKKNDPTVFSFFLFLPAIFFFLFFFLLPCQY